MILSLPLAYAMATSNHTDLQQINTNPSTYLAHQRETVSGGFEKWFIVLAIILGLAVAAIDGVTAFLARLIPDAGPARWTLGGGTAMAQPPRTGDVHLTTVMPAQAGAPRPLVAGLLSLFVPGLGQLYADDEKRAVVACLGTYAASLALYILFAYEPGLATYACVVAGIAFLVVANVAAATQTARRVAAASSHWDPRWPSIVVTGLLFLFGVRPAYQAAVRRSVGDTYMMPSSSMAPGLLAGDRITSVAIGRGAVQRGAVFVFHAWDGATLIKRAVGLPGDTLAMRNDTLMLDGRPVLEPYIYVTADTNLVDRTDADFAWQRARLTSGASTEGYHPTNRTWGPIVVPPDSVFVLGDNRENSLDSRYRGLVARSAFFARPTGIYFSRDPDSTTIRWGRIGTRVE